MVSAPPRHPVNGNGSSSARLADDDALPEWYHLEEPMGSSQRRLRVVCIGAGIAGIQSAHKFGSMPNVDFQCYEREASIGGVWALNKYPGVCCDIPSHVYSFSWAPNPRWTRFYAAAAEILAYLHDVVDKHDLRRHIKVEHEIIGSTWDEGADCWRIKIRHGDTVTEDCADILLLGTGTLNNWRWPDLDGLHDFEGQLMHTARWDETYDFTDKRVAVIGNGASAVQAVPILRKAAKQLDVYQRTPSWIAPHAWSQGKVNIDYTQEEMDRLAADPEALFAERRKIELSVNKGWSVFRRGSPQQKLAAAGMLDRYERLIADPVLRAKLTPSFEFGCRRPTPGDPFLAALQETNVDVIDVALDSVTKQGIRTRDGQEREYDAIVCATGFDSSYRPRYPLIGRDGRSLAEDWASHPEAYLGCMVNGYPNMFVYGGPGSPTGCAYLAIELGSNFFELMIKRMLVRNIKSFEPTAEAQQDFNEWAQRRYKDMVWTGACRSWYKDNKTNRVYVPWPGSTAHYAVVMSEINEADFAWKGRARNRFDYLGSGLLASEVGGSTEVDFAPYLRLGGIS